MKALALGLSLLLALPDVSAVAPRRPKRKNVANTASAERESDGQRKASSGRAGVATDDEHPDGDETPPVAPPVPSASGVLFTRHALVPRFGSVSLVNNESGPARTPGLGRPARGASRPAGRAKFSADLGALLRKGRPEDGAEVIIQLKGEPTARLLDLLSSAGVTLKHDFKKFKAQTLRVPIALVEELASLDEIERVCPDREVRQTGHVTTTIGADLVRSLASGGSDNLLDGAGVGIAVLDSGIQASHKSFKPDTPGYISLREDGQDNRSSRVILTKDFTGESRPGDAYGHGTHVAAAAAGSGRFSDGKDTYSGVAPGASLISLRVINAEGVGKVSWVLDALDWLLENGRQYNIRVVNLSLGAPAIDSYTVDPLCRAVRRLVDAGFVVVCAAGNDGKDAQGQKVFGRVHSPGSEPSAITVGATNTFGTDDRSDDVIATYSSRGPTRGYYDDGQGVRHYDNLIKPDLVAPGNRLIFAEADGNELVTAHPALHAAGDSANRRLMYLSGTSVAAPVVAGAVALLLQANPELTPNLIKAILMYTSQPLKGYNMFEQGAGELNVEGAVRLARLVAPGATSQQVGAPLLAGDAPAPWTTVAGQTFTWSRGMILGRTFAYGDELIRKNQKVYGLGLLLADGVLFSDGLLAADATLLSNGILLGDSILQSNGLAMAEGVPLLPAGVLFSDGLLLADGLILTDGVLFSDGLILADGAVAANALAPFSVLTGGDDTVSMK